MLDIAKANKDFVGMHQKYKNVKKKRNKYK